MAGTQLERKGGAGLVWGLVAVIALALLAWWFLAGENNEAAAVDDTTAVPVAATPDLGGGAVDASLTWAASTNAESSMGVSHEYTANGVRQLAAAIDALAHGDTLGGGSLDANLGALNSMADRLQTEPQSLKHADLAHAAFASAAQLLQDVQQKRFPNAGAQVAAVRSAADGISKDRPLLEQGATIKSFFDRAADALRAMKTGACV